jgi:hypothetical protein
LLSRTSTGATTVHAGYVTGLATDVSTGITATATEPNAQVRFYDMANQTGIAAVRLPCSADADQSSSGAFGYRPISAWPECRVGSYSHFQGGVGV